MAVSSGFFIFRIHVRLKVFQRLHLDDAFVLVALLLTIANATLWQVTSNDLYLGIAVSDGQQPLPHDLSKIYVYLHSQFASVFIYVMSLWLVKFSFLWFFRGLGNKIKRQQLVWWLVLGFTAVSFVIELAILDYKCLASISLRELGKM